MKGELSFSAKEQREKTSCHLEKPVWEGEEQGWGRGRKGQETAGASGCTMRTLTAAPWEVLPKEEVSG